MKKAVKNESEGYVYQTDMHSLFDAADDSAANSYYPKKLFQAVRGNNGNADGGGMVCCRRQILQGIPFYRKTSEYVVIKTI